MARLPPRTDTVAAIGAYLDLVQGKEVNPGVVTNWVNKFREYVPTVCDTPKINLIFGLDATVGPYPVFAEPLLPAADCTKFGRHRMQSMSKIMTSWRMTSFDCSD